jgi:YfiH family protein
MDGLLSKDGISYISSPLIAGAGMVEHGFLTRKGGVSQRPFDSLNFDERDGDSPQNVRQNRGLLAGAFGLPEAPLTVTQVHGCGVHAAAGYLPGRGPEADVIVTGAKGVAIGVLTADCLPVILYDPVRRAAATVHAGWRGTVKGVCLKAVEALEKTFGTDPADVVAALGPRIGRCCYGVGDEVLEAFRGAFGRVDDYLVSDAGGLRLDLARANADQLRSAGLSRGMVSTEAPCTSCNRGLFFSYRRDGARTGRQMSFIMLL